MSNSYSSRRPRRRSSFNTNSRRPRHGANQNRSRSNNRRRGSTIDPRRFVQAAKPVKQDVYVPKNSFSDFAMHQLLKENLASRQFSVPTQIQDLAIPPALQQQDIIGVANTGTGKTAAFLLPLLHTLISNKGRKALIIAPTRELAMQIRQEARLFGRGGKLFDALLIGGTPIGRQFSDLRRDPAIIIGTPGRIKDHLQRGSLQLEAVDTVVLDEVDRMLDMGFINDIRKILSKLPEKRQSFFFSATMTQTIEKLIRDFARSPVSIVTKTTETSDNVDQSVVNYVQNSEKIDKLHDLLTSEDVEKILIFSETKRSVEQLSRELNNRGFSTDAMHGDKSQRQRQQALKKFRSNHINVLVATDVASRGIDVDGITHVINYDVPQTYDDYAHRVGRAGRAGNVGYAVTFVPTR